MKSLGELHNDHARRLGL